MFFHLILDQRTATNTTFSPLRNIQQKQITHRTVILRLLFLILSQRFAAFLISSSFLHFIAVAKSTKVISHFNPGLNRQNCRRGGEGCESVSKQTTFSFSTYRASNKLCFFHDCCNAYCCSTWVTVSVVIVVDVAAKCPPSAKVMT